MDRRVVPSASTVGHSLGPGLAPGKALPAVSSPATIVDPHPAINQFLGAELGAGVDTVEQQVEARGTSAHARVADQVLANPFIHAVLSRQDSYTLLNSIAGTTLASGRSTTGATGQQDGVSYSTPEEATVTILGTDQSQVQVAATPGSQGFYATIPTANIRTNVDGTGSVLVPRSSIPPDVQVPATPTVPTGPLTDVFTSTGPVILSAFRSSAARYGPNAPRAIPGLRLSSAFQHNPTFPASRANALLYAFRVAVDRDVFALNSTQANALAAGVSAFEAQVAALDQAGAFQTAVPPAAPRLPRRELRGTLEVSLGALRNLSSVDPAMTGLQLPNIGNFPGRIDVGYVFDRSGNFGVALTARGALAGAPKNVASANVVAGDIQVEVSNAPGLSALNGRRSFEALNQGVGLSGGLSASNYANGVTTFAASAGYGSGLEFGTGTAYTQVIPLGNVYALIPSAPPK